MIYIAGPFFSDEEREMIQKTESVLSRRGYDFFSPRLNDAEGCEPQTRQWSEEIFRIDREAIDCCDIVLVVYHGNYSDTGTAWECGYAFAKGKRIVVVHTGESSNLMVHESAYANIRPEDLETYDFYEGKKLPYHGKMY